MEDQTFELSLKLTLPGKTLKKLKSYAMLSGVTVAELEAQLVAQVEPQLSHHFDQVLTDSIVGKLGELDGIDLVASKSIERSQTENDSHQLSGDDDVGENKSLEEMMAAPTVVPPPALPQPKARRQAPQPASEELQFNFNVPDVGNDVEAFVENTVAVETSQRIESRGEHSPYGAMTSSNRSFNPNKPRVRISEHTGEEVGYFD